MRLAKVPDSGWVWLRRSIAVSIFSLLFFCAGYLQAQAAEIVAGGGCSLVDAVHSANTDTGVNGCTAGVGDDTIILSDTLYLLDEADNSFGGSNNALPPISSTITISATGSGSTLLRDLSLGCPAAVVSDTFRFLYVNNDGNLNLKGVTLQNGCSEDGGAILNAGNLTLLQSSLISNTAGNGRGGGIYSIGLLTISQSTFVSNTARIVGGAIFFNEGRIERSSFSANGADEGGALFLFSYADKYLLSNHIIGNRSGDDGAAFYLASGHARFDNNLIAENILPSGEKADIVLGGAPQASTLQGNHNTIVAGPITGTAAIFTGADTINDRVIITDSIISGYSVGLVAYNLSAIEANGVLWHNTQVPTLTSESLITVSNAFSGSAAFVNPALHDYHITLPSLAINNAVSNLPAIDWDDDPRPVGVASDLGFDEFVPTISVAFTKTVGTDANSCSGSDSLNVEENSAVFYCFTVQNTGDITFTHHTFVDELLGVNTTLDSDLGPGETIQITHSQISELGPFTVTGSITNTAAVTSTNFEDDLAGAVVQGVEQFVATASDSGTAAVVAETPTGLPVIDQPRDNRLYLPALH